MEQFNLLRIEDTIWLLTTHVGVAAYDFDFERYFTCRHPQRIDAPITAVARMGAAQDYDTTYAEYAALGIQLIHTPQQYSRSGELPNWYPLIADLTPRSVWFDQLPTSDEVEQHFRWPVFVKGHRQTNRHRRDQAIIESRERFEQLMREWTAEPVLAWQKVICREFIPLRPVSVSDANSFPKSYEFRTFCWRGTCMAVGHYWISETYKLTAAEEREVIALAERAAARLELPFVVIDIAQSTAGKWIVIEVNDAQDSGYGGVSPLVLWSRIIDHERGRSA